MRAAAKVGPPVKHTFFRKPPDDPRQLRSWELRLLLMLTHENGATRLWASVLNYAIRELYQANHFVRQDALEWFTADYDHDMVGSFEFVCLQLGLRDPEEIRHDVLGEAAKWKDAVGRDAAESNGSWTTTPGALAPEMTSGLPTSGQLPLTAPPSPPPGMNGQRRRDRATQRKTTSGG